MTNILDQNVIGQTRAKEILKLIGQNFRMSQSMPPIGVFGPSGYGKCFAKGTMIKMYDGSTKKVEDIQNGEYVMGDDSTPRLVSGATSGQEEMFEIIPIKGDPFTVNASHILVLTNCSNGKIDEISVREYISKSDNYKNTHKLYRVAVDYDRYPVKIDPYFMGLWIGDGCWNKPSIANIDKEVICYLRQFASELCLNISQNESSDRCPVWNIVNTKGRPNPLKEDFKSYGLMLRKEKFIPREYIVNDHQTRLGLLAGLIDSDGSRRMNSFEISTKYKALALDIKELALSLGFWCRMTKGSKSCTYKGVRRKGVYYRLNISGDTDQIPTKITRKQAPKRKQIKNIRHTGFIVKPVGIGEYYGFAVDKNHRFLLSDFIVTHNTVLIESFAQWMSFKPIYINGTVIKDPLAFRAFFKEAKENLKNHYLVFIDECHNLPRKIQENLLSVLGKPSILCTIASSEMGNVRCVDGIKYIKKGDVIREELPTNLSFAFATTDPATMQDTILSRLRKIQLESYSLSEKAEIVRQYLVNNGISVDQKLCEELANRSRNIRNLKGEVCDTFMDVYRIYDESSQEESLERLDNMLGIDKTGATLMDIQYMEYIGQNNIAGLDTLAGVLKTDKKDILLRVEPFLLEKQWIAITGKGRTLTQAGRDKISEMFD